MQLKGEILILIIISVYRMENNNLTNVYKV